MHIYKTSIHPESYEHAEQVLSQHLDTAEWTLDLEDCDRVLRVLTEPMRAQQVADALRNGGWVCEEL